MRKLRLHQAIYARTAIESGKIFDTAFEVDNLIDIENEKAAAIQLKLVKTIFAPVWRILETIPEGDFCLQGIAIEPQPRGTGVGSILMNDIENRAKTSESNRISLDVSAKNDDAIRFYERLGMVESSTWPNSRFLPTVFIRISKYLKFLHLNSLTMQST